MYAHKKSLLTASLFYLILILISCNNNDTSASADEPTNTVTPVTVTSVRDTVLGDSVVLNATATYLQKWIVRANATGYIQSANLMLNENVQRGQTLFTIKTKEAVSLGNTINQLDSSFRFSGMNSIRSNKTGFVSTMDHQAGDYVQDGDQLAVITDTHSFVFLLDLPYELRPYILNKKSLEIVLPDNEKLTGYINGAMHTIDPSSQIQKVILQVSPGHPIPENLVGKVIVSKNNEKLLPVLPKEAVISNEMQNEFWVMKLTDSSLAVKVPITKGLESNGLIEIISPHFSPTDKIIITGNYGLEDSSKVVVIKP